MTVSFNARIKIDQNDIIVLVIAKETNNAPNDVVWSKSPNDIIPMMLEATWKNLHNVDLVNQMISSQSPWVRTK